MTACAVTRDLDRHLAEVEADQIRDDQIDNKVAEMELDERCVAGALDDVFSNQPWQRDPVTGKAGNMKLSAYLAGHVINGTDASARSVLNHLRELMREQLQNPAEVAVDAENNRNAIDAAEARLAHDEMEDAA